jgi:hypothetical protein
MDQVDIVAAFLSKDLEHTFYMELPEGSGIPDSKALRLDRAVYGLTQSCVESVDFATQVRSVYCLFISS